MHPPTFKQTVVSEVGEVLDPLMKCTSKKWRVAFKEGDKVYLEGINYPHSTNSTQPT
jgi:hypothetical protein